MCFVRHGGLGWMGCAELAQLSFLFVLKFSSCSFSRVCGEENGDTFAGFSGKSASFLNECYVLGEFGKNTRSANV